MILDVDFLNKVQTEIKNIVPELVKINKISDKDFVNILIKFSINMLENIDDRQRTFTGPNYPLILKRSAQITALAYVLFQRYKEFGNDKDQVEKFTSEWLDSVLSLSDKSIRLRW